MKMELPGQLHCGAPTNRWLPRTGAPRPAITTGSEIIRLHLRVRLSVWIAALFIAVATGLHAAPAAVPPPVDPPELVDLLLGEFDSPAAFLAAVAEAERRGASTGLIVRAHLRCGLREENVRLLRIGLDRATATAFVPRREVAWLMVIARGYLAGEAHHFDEAEQLFKTAFWMLPNQSETVGRAATYTHRMQRMAHVHLDLDRPYRTSTGGAVTLRSLLVGRKALLIDFWASWCSPCIQGLPALKQKQAQLAPLDIAVIGLNTEKDAAKAETVRKAAAITFPWLLDDETAPLDRQLDVGSIPRVVLLGPDGGILFNGDGESEVLTRLLTGLTGGKKE